MDPTEEKELADRIGRQFRPEMFAMVDAIFMYLVDDATDQITGEGPNGAELDVYWERAKELLIDYAHWRLPAAWKTEIEEL